MAKKSQIRIEYTNNSDEIIYHDDDNKFEARFDLKNEVIELYLDDYNSHVHVESLNELNEIKNFCRRILNHRKYFN